MKQLFDLGHVVWTPGIDDRIREAFPFLKRHMTGDWGELDQHDIKENNLSVKQGYRILSSYHLKDGMKFWIITEADRSSTTFLLPSEY